MSRANSFIVIFLFFQVPIEAERLLDNDIVLEQYLSPASPLLAGFRVDAFGAIKPLVTHSPSSNAQIWDRSSSLVDERHISPAVLYIQVSVVQVLLYLLFFCYAIGGEGEGVLSECSFTWLN